MRPLPKPETAYRSPNGAANTAKSETLATLRRQTQLLRPALPRSRAILRQKFSDFFSQNFVTRRAQVDLVGPEKRLNWFPVVSEHVGTDVDIFCFSLRLEKGLHELIEFQNVIKKHQTRRTWLNGDEGDRDRRGIASENRVQLLERLENLFRRRPSR